ncbi:MAG: DNA-processing protein DprA [Rikenellaceae bacterium]
MDIFDMALTLVQGLGDRGIAKLIDSSFSAERIFSYSYDELINLCKLREGVATAIATRSTFAEAERELKYCEHNNIRPIARVDLEYPTLLRSISNPPHVLYVQGDHTLLTKNLISMVGTRESNEAGFMDCNTIVYDIAEKIHNAVIVSGLAIGADSYAHRAALVAGVPTVAIVPTSLPNIIPASNRYIADAILERGGALVSELNSARGNAAGRGYLSRNRIIAGISKGTILIQSPRKGGAMSTMEAAREMGRVTMAIPGRISDYCATGCNMLIGLNYATSISSAEDIIRALDWRERRLDNQSELTKLGKEFDFSGKVLGGEVEFIKRAERGESAKPYRATNSESYSVSELEQNGDTNVNDETGANNGASNGASNGGSNGTNIGASNGASNRANNGANIGASNGTNIGASNRASNGVNSKRIEGERVEVDLSTLSKDQAAMLRSFASTDRYHFSTIEKLSKMPTQRVNVLLVELELLGMIKALPGAIFQRVVAINDIGKR